MTQANEAEIYKEIKQAIIQQKLRPNIQLVEDVIAESFGVSRTPVRNVLRRLAYEKLVKIIPHKGTFVSCPTVEEAKEVFEMRRVLEADGIRKACSRLTEKQFQQLKSLLHEEHELHDKGDLLGALQISGDFHLKIAKIAGNSYYYRYLEELVSLTYVIIAFYGQRQQLTFCRDNEHEQILNAMKRQDEKLAERLMLEHLTHIEKNLDFDETFATPMSLADIFKVRVDSSL
ncbi:GntR family transcriptional regulator [Effusibacillus consociatus]|uniref:GntR family transcriptional regulator n=1 Tax=Effusibacillus consociatus TaxID=1117041 RepID=A0ABV9PXU0_9BACL